MFNTEIFEFFFRGKHFRSEKPILNHRVSEESKTLINIQLRESESEKRDFFEETQLFLELNEYGRNKVIDYTASLMTSMQYHSISENRLKLWPHNRNTNVIDKEYYDSLPSVPRINGIKEYIKCFPVGDYSGEAVNPYEEEPLYDDMLLVEFYTEEFESREESEHFQRAAVKRYCIQSGEIIEKNDEGKYIFFAYALGAMIQDKFNVDGCYWMLENWTE